MESPWTRHYDPGVPLEIEPPKTSIPWMLKEAAERSPASPAMHFLGKVLTYGEFRDQALRVARSLRNLGLAPGDRVAMLLPNCPQLVLTYYAVLHLGGVVVFINPLSSPKEIRHHLVDSGARRLVILDHLLPKAEEVLNELELTHHFVTGLPDTLPWPLSWLYPIKAWREGLARGFKPGPGRLKWRDLLKAEPLAEPPVPQLDDSAILQYTGGTTGIPKAAILSHKNVMSNVAQINAWLPQMRYGTERVVGLIPFFHVFGLTVCLNWPVSQGAQVIMLPRFDVEVFLQMLKKQRPTVLPGVPTLFVALLNHPELPKVDLSDMWACVSGSAPLPLEVREKFEALANCRIIEGYGLTEASPATHFNPLEGLRPAGSIGIPFPSTQARIIDPATGAREMPLGEVGELCIKGPQVMAGYWNKPEETAQVLQDGWLLTGDLAKMDENGYFYIIDRKKDLIISSGFKIFPREVEEVLYQHPKVKEAVVYGHPDSYRGELVKAVIVPQPHENLTAEEVRSYCEDLLAQYKIPRIIEFRPELPKSAVGKVLRRLLRDEDQKTEAA